MLQFFIGKFLLTAVALQKIKSKQHRYSIIVHVINHVNELKSKVSMNWYVCDISHNCVIGYQHWYNFIDININNLKHTCLFISIWLHVPCNKL